MADLLGRAAILSTVVGCGVGLLVVVVTPRMSPLALVGRPGECDGRGAKGEERITPAGQHQWFDGQCWTTTPQPPRDRPASDLYRYHPLGHTPVTKSPPGSRR